MKKNQLQKLALSLCAMGILFTSCEKEEMNEQIDVEAVEFEEAPFTNYMVISSTADDTKSVENFLKIGGGDIVSSIPEIRITIVSSKHAQFIQNTMKNKNVTSVVPDYEIAWIPSEGENDFSTLDVSTRTLTPSPGSTEGAYVVLWGMEA